jgi:hypothetical protein
MSNKHRHFAGWITVAVLCTAAALFWASSRAPVAYGSDVATRSMGAAAAEPATPERGIWERFDEEKRAAPEAELPAQF